MGLWREIEGFLGAGDLSRICYTVVDGRGGYFENVVRLLRFTETEVVLRGKRGSLRVTGEGLSLGKVCAGDVEVRGAIASIVREE